MNKVFIVIALLCTVQGLQCGSDQNCLQRDCLNGTCLQGLICDRVNVSQILQIETVFSFNQTNPQSVALTDESIGGQGLFGAIGFSDRFQAFVQFSTANEDWFQFLNQGGKTFSVDFLGFNIVSGDPEKNSTGAAAIVPPSLFPITNLVPNDLMAGDQFGFSVAAADGIVMVGAPGKASDSGAIYHFDPSGTQILKITSPGGRFGRVIGLNERYLVAGTQGLTQVYQNVNGTFISDGSLSRLNVTLIDLNPETDIVALSDGNNVDLYDLQTKVLLKSIPQSQVSSIALSSNLLAVGIDAAEQVLLYRQVTDWSLDQTITTTFPQVGFGSRLAFRKNRLLVASTQTSPVIGDQAPAYIFEASDLSIVCDDHQNCTFEECLGEICISTDLCGNITDMCNNTAFCQGDDCLFEHFCLEQNQTYLLTENQLVSNETFNGTCLLGSNLSFTLPQSIDFSLGTFFFGINFTIVGPGPDQPVDCIVLSEGVQVCFDQEAVNRYGEVETVCPLQVEVCDPIEITSATKQVRVITLLFDNEVCLESIEFQLTPEPQGCVQSVAWWKFEYQSGRVGDLDCGGPFLPLAGLNLDKVWSKKSEHTFETLLVSRYAAAVLNVACFDLSPPEGLVEFLNETYEIISLSGGKIPKSKFSEISDKLCEYNEGLTSTPFCTKILPRDPKWSSPSPQSKEYLIVFGFVFLGCCFAVFIASLAVGRCRDGDEEERLRLIWHDD